MRVNSISPQTSYNILKSEKSAKIMMLMIFFSLTPIFGEGGRLISIALISIYSFFASFDFHKSNFLNFSLLLIIIIPITIYDAYLSINYGFITYSYILVFISIISAYIISSCPGRFDYLDIYESAFLPICIISFLLYIIYISQPQLAYNLPAYEYRDTHHRTAYMLNILMNPGPVLRNSGIASEPGFYQLFVNLALFARMRRIGKPDKLCLFYVIVVISTLSTTGLFISAFLITYKFDLKYRLLILIFIVVFWSITIEVLQNQLNTKIFNENVFGPRFEPSINAIQIIIENPLGIGSFKYTETYNLLKIGSFDSFTQIGLRYGVPALLVILFLLANLARSGIALAVLLCLSFSTSPIWFNPIVAACYFLKLRIDQGIKDAIS